MAIYKRCVKCKSDLNLSARKCNRGHRLVDPMKDYKLKVKLKVITQEGRTTWRSKVLPYGSSIGDAEVIQNELLMMPPKNQPKQVVNPATNPKVIINPKQELEAIDFDPYYDYAKLTKASYLDDLQRYNKYLKGNDWQTSQGVLKILANAKEGMGLAPATVKHIYALIKRIHNWHIENDTHPTGKNPCQSIRLPKFDNKITNPLCIDDCSRLLSHLKDTESNIQMSCLVSLALLTGRRKGELLSLLREDIDLERGSITCRNTKSGKTLSFPVNDLSTKWLSVGLANEWHDERLFSYTGGGVNKNWSRLKVRLLKDKIITKDIRFHDLRHTHATLLANGGTSLYVIQRLLGHSTIELTQRYAHLNDKTMRDAVAGLL